MWEHSPQRLKNLQKINAMTGENKALTRLLTNQLMAKYGDEDIRKELSALDLAARDKDRERRLGLNEQRLGLRGDMLDFNKSQGKKGEAIGWANVGTSGLFGLGDLYSKKKYANTLNDIAKVYGE